MEEILASIRRIIADDEPPKAAAPAPKPVPAPPPRAAAPPPPPAPAPRAPMPARPAAPPPIAGNQDEFDAALANVGGPPQTTQAEPDILELTESMTAPEASFRTIDGQPDVIFTDNEAEPPVEQPHSDPADDEAHRQFNQSAAERTLLSTNTMAAVDSAFNTLAQTVLVQNSRTLEDLVREMMRPMLKTWLDDNLPGLVERIVRAEIERVSRGRTG